MVGINEELIRAVSRTEARRRVPVLFPRPRPRCRLRRTSGHATAAAGQAVKTKTYFSFRVDVWDDLRNASGTIATSCKVRACWNGRALPSSPLRKKI